MVETETTKRLDKALEREEIYYEKCQKCGKELEHWKKCTQVIYCHVCDGQYCIDCWYEHREEEIRKQNEHQS